MATKKYISFSNLTSFFDNLKNLFATKTEVDTKVNAKSDKAHTHSISNVSGLQSALDGKAASSHGTHVSYSSTAPVVDGTAAVGTASTVARSDHRHPTDTSRAAKADLESLEAVVSSKANSSHSHTISNVTNLQTALDGKANSSHAHTVSQISDLTATVKELNYMDGVTSSVQTQLDGKAASGHTHKYAGSSSAGGAATSANKLNTNAGSATQPVYFSNGVPVATTYTLGKSVPSDAKFTDTNTHYSSKNVVGATNATSNTATALTNGNVYINSVENGAVTSSHKISGSGATTVTTDTSGNIIISSTDNNTTYSAAGSALGLVKSGGDVTISSGVITVNDDSHNHTIANIDNLQSSLDAKQATITGGASTITSSNLTANRALISNGSGKVAVSDITSTELGYLDGVKSNVQTQLDGKAASSHTHSISNVSGLQSALDGKSSTSHTHSYAGSPSVGGGANTLAITDTRNINDTPTEMTNLIGGKGARLDFKSTGTVGLSNGNYAAVLSISPWGDTTNWSGGKNTQLGFCDDGRIQVRKGNDSGWTDWNTIIDSSTIGNQNVKYATSAGSATSATKATQDASGNTITSTYATKTELDTAKSTLQTSINGKANSSHTHTIANITNLQTTLDGKSSTSHTHKYAGSSSVGGSATSAVKLDTSTAGDANTPVYFSGGKPVACTSLDLNTSGSSSSCTGNSATATKLQTARTIGLGTGATGTATSFDGTGNITIPVTDVKESYLSWGGKNSVGSVTPIGAALSSEHSANRLAYLNPAAIKVEYSNDAGSTWTDSGLGNSAKINFVTTSNGISVGSNSTVTTSHRTRVTLTAQNGTTGYVYTRPRKMLINVSTAGHGLTVTIEAKTGVSGASWTTLGTYELNGWSGWNDIPMGISTFGGGTNQTGNYWYMRLTFANTSVNSSYTTTKSSIIGLRLFGDTCWTRTSNMGETGHLYSYDSSQNATFPANVTAATFSGTTFSGGGVATLAEVKTYLGI